MNKLNMDRSNSAANLLKSSRKKTEKVDKTKASAPVEEKNPQTSSSNAIIMASDS